MADNKVEIDLSLKTDGFSNAINSASKQADTFAKKTTTNFSTIQSSFAVMAGSLAAGAFTALTRSISGGFQKAIQEASDAEKELNTLNTALKMNGLYSKETSDSFVQLAEEIEKTTLYTEGQVQENVALLASMTQLDKEGIQRSIKAATDLAATYNLDLTTATQVLAKASNGQTASLEKLGIQFDKSGSKSQQFESILQQLESRQGTAAAKVNTFEGAQNQLEDASNKVFESIGLLITQNPVVIGAIQSFASVLLTASNQLSNFGGWVQENVSWLEPLAFGLTVVGTSLAVIAIKSAIATVSFSTLATSAMAAWLAITSPIALVVAGLAVLGAGLYAIIKHWDSIKAGAYNALAAVIEFGAKGVEIFSPDKAAVLRLQAQGFRDQAAAITAATQATQNKTAASAEDDKQAAEQAAIRAARLAEEQKETLAQNEFLKSQKQLNSQELLLIDQQADLALSTQKTAFQEQQALEEATFDTARLENFNLAAEARLAAQQDLDRQELELQIAKQVASAKQELDEKKRRENLLSIEQKANIDRRKLETKQELDEQKLRLENEKKLDEQRTANRKDTYSTIATLSNSNNKQLAAIGKAAGITQIAIDTPVAISKALAAFPPPFNFVAAGAVGVAMAAQAAQIAGINFADGGIVPGSSMTGDRISANLNSGEMVLNRTQQSNLFKIANSGSNSTPQDTSRVESLLGELIDVMRSGTSFSIDGREIINVVRDGISSGRSIA